MRLAGPALVERVGPVRIQRLSWAALLASLVNLTLFNLYQVWIAFPHKLVESDFRIWYAAASIGPRWGWSHLYDSDLMRQAVEAVWPGSRYLPFANPPPAAWIILPFTLLPFGAALTLWTVLSVALLIALSQVFAPKDLGSRAAFALSALAFLPTFVMVEAAPLSPVVLGAVGACTLLLWRGHHLWAGVALSLIAVKPNIAVLVPVALLAAGYLRVFVAWLTATVLMLLISVLTIGSHGVISFFAVNVSFIRDDYYLTFSLTQVLGGSVQYAIAAVAIVGIALFAAYRRRVEPGIAIAAGVVGSLLINHHLTPADFTLLLIPIWIVMAISPPIYLRLIAGLLWAAGWTSSLGLAWPVAAMEVLLLVGFAVPAKRAAA